MPQALLGNYWLRLTRSGNREFGIRASWGRGWFTLSIGLVFATLFFDIDRYRGV